MYCGQPTMQLPGQQLEWGVLTGTLKVVISLPIARYLLQEFLSMARNAVVRPPNARLISRSEAQTISTSSIPPCGVSSKSGSSSIVMHMPTIARAACIHRSTCGTLEGFSGAGEDAHIRNLLWREVWRAGLYPIVGRISIRPWVRGGPARCPIRLNPLPRSRRTKKETARCSAASFSFLCPTSGVPTRSLQYTPAAGQGKGGVGRGRMAIPYSPTIQFAADQPSAPLS
jgi:hypothetical protein